MHKVSSTMSLSISIRPFTTTTTTTYPQTHQRIPLFRSAKPTSISAPAPAKLSNLVTIRSVHKNPNSDHSSVVAPAKPRWENLLSTAASLYPLYVTVGGVVACFRPSTFSWFVQRGPASYSLSLGFIMLAMGLTLDLRDLFNLLRQRPLSMLGTLTFCLCWFNIAWLLPRGYCIQRVVQVTLIARGDVPLSIVMTVCTTFGAVILTPLLTKILAGTYVPVDAAKLSISTLQVVVAPILLGSFMQSTFPSAVKVLIPFAPLFAVLASSLLACSVFSENVARLTSLVAVAPLSSKTSPFLHAQAILSGELGVIILSVLLLHFAGFFVGYASAAFSGFKEPQRRAISIEVGMQNSSLGVVLAVSHFTSPMVTLPPAMSAVIMNIMGSSLGFFWRYVDPSDHKRTS